MIHVHVHVPRQVNGKKFRDVAVVKHQRTFVVFGTTSNVKGLSKNGALPPLFSDFPAVHTCTFCILQSIVMAVCKCVALMQTMQCTFKELC